MCLKLDCFFIFAVLFLIILTTNVHAQDVRGRLDGVGPYGAYPVPRIAVTLFTPNYGRTRPVYSDYQGMYYIYNIPPGQHTLEIWVYDQKPMKFRIFVNPNKRLTDIAPIRIK